MTKWTRLICRETLERIEVFRRDIEAGLVEMGHEPDAVLKVEQAMELLLRQPVKDEKEIARNDCRIGR